ncbi:MAG: hypothetical protein JWP57_3240 [Spirosoma sp.]|nr:hypothetical protein [Spirosoma sp.]
MILGNRKDKLALLSALVNGSATPKQISDLHKSREVIYLTMQLDDSEEPQESDYPEYHMEFDRNWKLIRHYDLFEDGRIEEREMKFRKKMVSEVAKRSG